MINKKAKLGDHEDVVLVEMGTGDILISAIDWPDTGHHGILLCQDKPKDIKDWNSVTMALTAIEDAKNPIVIRFSRKESIDQLIRSLQEARANFKD